MRRVATLAIGAVVLAGCGADSRVARYARPAQPAKPSVEVVPRSGPPGTVFEVRGRGWAPWKTVEAVHGPYCDQRFCHMLGLAKLFRARADGTFVFRFREGPDARGLPEPAAAGSGLVTLEQWTGRPYRSKLIRVRPRYRVTPG